MESRETEGARRAAWWAIGLAVVLGFVLRLGVVRQYDARHPMADRPQVDEASYDRWAQRLAGGDWLGDRVFFQEPGYAYGLGLVYTTVEAEHRFARMRRVQVALGALSVGLTGWLAFGLFGPLAGGVAAFVLAIYRPALLAPCLLLKVNVALPVVLGIALVLLRARRRGWPPGTALGLGLLAGLGATLRGNLLVLIPAFALWPLFRRAPWRQRAARSGLVLAGALLALSPVLVRNWVVGRVVAVTSGAGTNFYGGNNAENPDGVATEFDWIRAIPEHEPDDWRREAERRVGHELDPVEVSGYWLGAALRSMREDPGLHARIFWNKLRLLLSAYEVPDNHHLDWDARFVPLLRAPWGGFGTWGLLALAGALTFLWRRRPLAGIDPLILFALYGGTIVLTVMSMRARLAIVPLLLPFVGWYGGELLAAWRARSSRRGLLGSGALLLAGLIVHWPFYTAFERQQDLDERDFNLAVHLLRDDAELDQVERIADELEGRYPAAPRVVVLQADIDYHVGRKLLDSAEATARARGAQRIEAALARLEGLDRSIANAHELFRTDYLAGAILQFQGRFREAAARLRAARQFDDDDRDVRRRLALCLANASVEAPEPDRQAGLAEALRLYDGLLAEEPEPGLERLREQVRAALESP